jgi:hypothetical protein
MRGQYLQHLLITYSLAEISDDGSIGNMRYGVSYLGEAGDKGPEGFPGFLPHCVEVGLHAMLFVSVGEVRCEPRAELFPGVDRSWGKVHEPSSGWPRQGYMEVCCHYGGVSTCCRNGGDIHLHEFRRVSRTVIFLRQVWPELGQPSRHAEMIRQRGATHAGQWDTRLDPGVHRSLQCNRSKVIVEVATLDVLSTLSRPLQRDAGILARMPAVEFCPQVIRPPRVTRASSPARRRLSSTRRSSIGATLIKGERTDADASCWRRDDRGLGLVEPECAMPSRRSTSSHHCFMDSGEAVEQGGWHNSSLAADSAPGAALDALDACAGVCCRAECTTTAAPGAERLVARGVEEAASSSSMKSSGTKSWCSMMWTMMSSRRTSKNLKPRPLPGAPIVGRNSLAGWRNAPTLNPKMRRGLSILPVRWKQEEHKNTQGFRVVQAAEA